MGLVRRVLSRSRNSYEVEGQVEYLADLAGRIEALRAEVISAGVLRQYDEQCWNIQCRSVNGSVQTRIGQILAQEWANTREHPHASRPPGQDGSSSVDL